MPAAADDEKDGDGKPADEDERNRLGRWQQKDEEGYRHQRIAEPRNRSYEGGDTEDGVDERDGGSGFQVCHLS